MKEKNILFKVHQKTSKLYISNRKKYIHICVIRQKIIPIVVTTVAANTAELVNFQNPSVVWLPFKLRPSFDASRATWEYVEIARYICVAVRYHSDGIPVECVCQNSPQYCGPAEVVSLRSWGDQCCKFWDLCLCCKSLCTISSFQIDPLPYVWSIIR